MDNFTDWNYCIAYLFLAPGTTKMQREIAKNLTWFIIRPLNPLGYGKCIALIIRNTKTTDIVS